MEISIPKLKIKQTWNEFDRVGVKFEDDSIQFIKSPWYFGTKIVDRAKVKEVLKGKYYKIDDNIRYPDYDLIYADDIWKDKEKIQDKYSLVELLESKEVETFEGDLMNDKRWYIDNKVEIAEKFKKLYFDIETDDSLEKIEIGRDMILSFSAIDNDGKIYFESVKEMTPDSEKEFLSKVLKIFNKYDLIIGWNSSGFDIPYLKDRMRKYDLHKSKDYKFRQLGHYDLLNRMRHIFRFDTHLRSFSLQFISNHFLGKGKVERHSKVIDLWKNDKKKLKEYNIEDSVLVKELDEKLGVTDMMIRQSSWCGVPPSQFGLYSIIDAYILQTAHKIGKLGKTSVNAMRERNIWNVRGNVNPEVTETDKGKYLGAIVLDPKVGVYDKVYTFDFKGLYPSMMRTSNIGYDTLKYEANDSYITNPGTLSTQRSDGTVKPTYFEKTPSVVNLAITDLIKKRKIYKDLKLKMIEDRTNSGVEWESVVSNEIIVKELANSTYGIMGLSYGRYYNIDVAESITLFGQWCITFAKNFFERRGYEVIYGDTDSVFVNAGEIVLDVDEELKIFHSELELELKKYNIDKSYIELNFDKEYNKFILFAKKTYAGHVVNIEGKHTDEVYVRGLDYIKKSTFGYAAKKQKELINMILKEKYDKDSIKLWCKTVKNEFFTREFTALELTLTNKIGKDFKDYKTLPLAAKIAKNVADRTGENFKNTEVEYIITMSGIRLDGILSKHYEGKFDRQYYWDHKVAPVLQRVIDVLYPDIMDIFTPQLNLF